MRTIAPYALPDVLASVRAGRVTERGLEVIDRMTDDQLATCDIRSVLLCVWLQQSEIPVSEIPAEWWDQVMEGSKIV